MISFHLGDHVQPNEHAPTKNGQPGIVTDIGRTIIVRFEDSSTGAFFPDEVEIVKLLSESPNVFYFLRGTDVMRYAHGTVRHYCIFSLWERSSAFKRGGKSGALVSMAPDKFLGGFGATRLA